MSAAQVGRTHGRIDQPCISVQAVPANEVPSTHGTLQTYAEGPLRAEQRPFGAARKWSSFDPKRTGALSLAPRCAQGACAGFHESGWLHNGKAKFVPAWSGARPS